LKQSALLVAALAFWECLMMVPELCGIAQFAAVPWLAHGSRRWIFSNQLSKPLKLQSGQSGTNGTCGKTAEK